MQRNIVETVLGGIVLLVAAGFLLFAYKTADISPIEGYQVNAKFASVDGLEVGSLVKIGGVRIGKVLSLELDPVTLNAIVNLNVASGIKLTSDTVAKIASGGLLGDKHLSLEPGNEEDFIEPNGMIEYTQSTPSLEALLGQAIFKMGNTSGESN